MRRCAVAGSQRRMATVLKSVCPLLTTRVPLSRYGLSTDIAPLKKKVALLSSGDPANSSTLSGPLAAAAASAPSSVFRPSPTSSEVACWTPTLKLSKVA